MRLAHGLALVQLGQRYALAGYRATASLVVIMEAFREDGRLHSDLFERERLRLLFEMLDDGGVIDPVDVPPPDLGVRRDTFLFQRSYDADNRSLGQPDSR